MKTISNFIKIDYNLININDIKVINLSLLNSETIIVTLFDNTEYEVHGFPALELVWILKPSCLEGNPNIKFKKHMWSIHNLIAHPLMQILAYLKLYRWAIWIHDVTVPKPIGIK